MISDIRSLDGVYDSNEMDVVESFYIPLFRMSERVDRISCYFSSRALSTYSRGLLEFARKPNTKYRLIVSTYINEDDFNSMVEGEEKQKEIDSELAARLREHLTQEEEANMSNLAYLISLGIVEFKIAYVKEGIFHYKMGYAEDESGDSIFFMGSNNETESAILRNYEMFTATDGSKEKHRFENYWNNRMPGVKAFKPSKSVILGIQRYDKGRLIELGREIPPADCIFLDYVEGEIRIDNLIISPPSNYNLVHLSKIGKHIESYSDVIIFKKGRNYVDCEQIVQNLKTYCTKKGYKLVVSHALSYYIEENNLIIDQRRTLGLDIKRQESKLFPRYEQYKVIVDSCMVRELRDMQMWDSFFMYSMKKAGNFSVPGSGKTSSALGVFAYLRHMGEVKRIIMIGPLNSFDSWIGEYRACFGDDGAEFFDARYNKGSADAQRNNLLSSFTSKTMFLFNYDSLSKYAQAIKDYLLEDSLLIFDEAHYIKSVQAKRSRQSLTVSEESSRTIIMTGTPMPNSYVDLYNPLHVLFPSEYDGYFGYSVSTLSNPDEVVSEDINRKLQPFFCRTSKDKLGVPPPNPDSDEVCNASDLELRLYQEVLSRYKSNRLALIVRVLQMESDPKMLLEDCSDSATYFLDDMVDDDAIDAIDLAPTMEDSLEIIDSIEVSTKTRRCIELIKRLVSEGKNVITWCIFTRSIENIASLLREHGISCRIVYGSTPLAERTATIESFKKGGFSVLITNPHTLAESISLHTACHDAVYFEYSYNLVHLLQSKDRIHRLGIRPGQYTQYYFMKLEYRSITDGISSSKSLGEQIHQRLRDKENVMMEAIDSGKLEQASTSEEDIDYIYRKMGWN